MAIPNVRAHVFSLPAQRTDGRTDRDNALPEGAHLRLDPDLDLDALNLPAPMRAIARAAQKYGIYIRDGGTNVALYGQDPTPFGVDPYPQLFGGMSAGELMRWFPWTHLQVLRMDLRRDSDSGGGGGGPAACQLLHCR
jgi:hypothetical protein